ncbi:MAG: tyrosine-type recombinase/integrase [Ignavibacteriales bacterium]|nr:tyrosine-type recombinase/integrase [Ignavibacteriales bacterium]
MFLSRSKKSPFYQIIYEVEGKRTTVSTKTTDLNEARKFLASFSIPVKINNVVYEANNSILLEDFKNEYVGFTKLSKSKYYITRSIEPAFKFFIQHCGNILLSEVTTRHIDNFIMSTYKRTQSGSALYYRTLKAAFSKAVVWNLLQENPFKKIKAPKVNKSVPQFITEEQLNLILDKTDRQFLKDIFTTAFFTGMRLGELLNMRSSWIDFTQNIIITKNSNSFTTKSKKERIIPIHPKVLSILLKLNKTQPLDPSEDYFIFSHNQNIKFNEDFISKQFKKAVRAAKLNDQIHLHTLRHSFASNLVQKGASLYVVKELLGHEDIKTTQIYSHLLKKDLMQAVSSL